MEIVKFVFSLVYRADLDYLLHYMAFCLAKEPVSVHKGYAIDFNKLTGNW